MAEKILYWILIADLIAFLLLWLACWSKDFLNWCSRKDDPEWWAEYDKYEKDFLRLKSEVNSSSKEWGA